MDKIKVKLFDYFSKESAINALKIPYENENANEDLLNNVIKVRKHESIAEKIVMEFIIKDNSRLELQEHVRHRIASPTVKSSRYTLQKMSLDNCLNKHVHPNNLKSEFNIPDKLAIEYHQRLNDLIRHSAEFIEFCQLNSIPNDLAKYGVLESLRTHMSWTINLRSLRNFLKLRLDKHSHFEIRYIANLIIEELKGTYIERLIDDIV